MDPISPTKKILPAVFLLFEKPVRWVRFIEKSSRSHGEKRQATDSRTWSLVALSELPASVAASLEDGSWEFQGAHLSNANKNPRKGGLTITPFIRPCFLGRVALGETLEFYEILMNQYLSFPWGAEQTHLAMLLEKNLLSRPIFKGKLLCIPGGAGFLPSTACFHVCSFQWDVTKQEGEGNSTTWMPRVSQWHHSSSWMLYHVDVISRPKQNSATKWPKQSKKPQERWYKINVTSNVSTFWPNHHPILPIQSKLSSFLGGAGWVFGRGKTHG